MKRLSLYALYVLALSAQAQDTYINPTISVPPAPTAASLGKYGDVPVGLYTGVPNISIPLYNIKEGNLNLPVSLSYHSQGFKTEELASNVGLGWSLNAGGVITRAVKGVPDDFNGDLWGSNAPSSYNNYCAGGTYVGNNVECSYPSYGYLTTRTNIEPLNYSSDDDYEKLAKNILDGEQDIFYFNFAGYSGSFVFNKDGAPRFFSKQNLEVTYSRDSNGDIYKFQIVDGDGNIYYFEDYEVSTTTNSHFSAQDFYPGYGGNEIFYANESDNSFFDPGTKQPPFISSWHLTKIKNASSTHEINFTYSNETQQYKNNFSQQYAQGSVMNNFSRSVSYNSVVTKKLYSIVWSQGKITYSYAHERQDIGCNLPGGITYIPTYALTDIFIYDAVNTLLKKYKLDYNYFGTAPFANPAQNTGSNFDCNFRKLKLLSVKEFNAIQTESKPAYLFDYDISVTPAPTYTAKKDFWGYQKITAPVTTQSRIPKMYYHGVIDAYSKSQYAIIPYKSYVWSSGVYDISPEAAGQTAFLLTKITYPTGGSTSLEYEPHEYNLLGTNRIGGGARIKKITDSDGAGNNVIKNYSYKDAANPSLSSGVIMSLPTHVKNSVSCNQSGNFTIFTKSLSGLGSTFGSTVGYKRVVVDYNGNGKTESFFNTQGAIGSVSEECAGSNCMYQSTTSAFVSTGNCDEDNFPFAENPNFDWFRGVLEEERIYNSSNQMVRKTVNEYTTKNYEKIRWLKVGIYNNAPLTMRYSYSYLLSGWKVLSKQTTTEYDVLHAGRQLQTVVNYYYDNADHLQLTKTSTADSKGRITETIYRRSKDYTGTGTVLTTLINQHRLNEVIEKQVWLSGSPKKLLGAEFTDYKDYSAINGNTASQFLPSKKYILETAAPVASTAFNDTYFNTNPVLDSRYKLVSEFNFDKKDNLTRRSLINEGPKDHNIAIFGHSKNLVIANVENASEVECGFTSFESDDYQFLWGNGSNLTLSSDAHCGTKSCNVVVGDYVARNFFVPVSEQNKKYIFSGWVKTNSAAAGEVGRLVICTVLTNGSNTQYPGDTEAYQYVPIENTNGQWKYLEVKMDIVGLKNIAGLPLSTDLGMRAFIVNTSSSTPILADDLRFHPKDARMSTYTHIPLVGVSSMSDENSNCIFYEYDTFGRLKLTKDQNGKILEKTDYNYKP